MIKYFDENPMGTNVPDAVTDYLRNFAEGKEGYGGSYLAGTLVISDPTGQGKSICIDIKPISELDESLKEMCYYASQLYIKHKSPTAHFSSTARQNIEEYKTFKKLDDFINVRNEFSES